MELFNKFKFWVKQLQKGDQSAFIPLYENTAPALLRFLMWKTRGDKPLAEDVLQETYVKFLLSLDRMEETREVAVKAYLMQIAKNCLIDKTVRNKHVKNEHLALEDAANFSALQTIGNQERAIEMRDLSVLLSSLSERESEILWLRDGLGLSHKEVADEVGMTEPGARQAYVRARKSLLEQIQCSLGSEKGLDYGS